MLLQKLVGCRLQGSRNISSALNASSEHTGNNCPVRMEYPFFCRVFRAKGLRADIIEDLCFPVWVVPRALCLKVVHPTFDLDLIDDPSNPQEPLRFSRLFHFGRNPYQPLPFFIQKGMEPSRA